MNFTITINNQKRLPVQVYLEGVLVFTCKTKRTANNYIKRFSHSDAL